jgi:hypothetical protein
MIWIVQGSDPGQLQLLNSKFFHKQRRTRYTFNIPYKPLSLLLQHEWNLGTKGCLFYPVQLYLSSESPTLFHVRGCKHRNTSGSPTSKANLAVASCLSSSCRKRLKFKITSTGLNCMFPWEAMIGFIHGLKSSHEKKEWFRPILQIIKVKLFLHVSPYRKSYRRHRHRQRQH